MRAGAIQIRRCRIELSSDRCCNLENGGDVDLVSCGLFSSGYP